RGRGAGAEQPTGAAGAAAGQQGAELRAGGHAVAGRAVPAPGPAERRDADQRLPGADRSIPGGADQRLLHRPPVLGPAAVQDARRVVPEPAADLPGTRRQPRRAERDPAARANDRGEVVELSLVLGPLSLAKDKGPGTKN